MCHFLCIALFIPYETQHILRTFKDTKAPCYVRNDAIEGRTELTENCDDSFTFTGKVSTQLISFPERSEARFRGIIVETPESCVRFLNRLIPRVCDFLVKRGMNSPNFCDVQSTFTLIANASGSNVDTENGKLSPDRHIRDTYQRAHVGDGDFREPDQGSFLMNLWQHSHRSSDDSSDCGREVGILKWYMCNLPVDHHRIDVAESMMLMMPRSRSITAKNT